MYPGAGSYRSVNPDEGVRQEFFVFELRADQWDGGIGEVHDLGWPIVAHTGGRV